VKTINGLVVVITGASSGIGAATALALARQGAKLVLGARRTDKLEAIAQQCRDAGGQAIAMKCDVAQRADVAALITRAVTEFGRLDVVLANAGYGFLARIHDATEQEFDDIVDVNVKGTWYAMQEAAPIMLKQKSGHIIAVSSGAARIGLPLYGIYSMTKACQLSLVQAMRVELRRTGVYVSSVHPTTTTTEFFDVASNRSKMRSSGVGMAQTADHVANRIVSLIRRPRPEVWPMRAARLGLALAALFPRLGDFAMSKTVGKRKR
jgi:short-subunit dehydrogenase